MDGGRVRWREGGWEGGWEGERDEKREEGMRVGWKGVGGEDSREEGRDRSREGGTEGDKYVNYGSVNTVNRIITTIATHVAVRVLAGIDLLGVISIYCGEPNTCVQCDCLVLFHIIGLHCTPPFACNISCNTMEEF